MIEPKTNATIRRYKQTDKYKATQQAWRLSHQGQRSILKSRLKTKFGITLEDYDNLHIKHNNSCALCNTPESELLTKLCIDHCHTTNKVRGLLCDACNVAIGLLKDDKTLLTKAIKYLEENS